MVGDKGWRECVGETAEDFSSTARWKEEEKEMMAIYQSERKIFDWKVLSNSFSADVVKEQEKIRWKEAGGEFAIENPELNEWSEILFYFI